MLACVTVDEGLRMISRLRAEPADVTIGMPVRVGYEDVTPDGMLFVLRPGPEPV